MNPYRIDPQFLERFRNDALQEQKDYEYMMNCITRVREGYRLLNASAPDECAEIHLQAQAQRDAEFNMRLTMWQAVLNLAQMQYREAFENQEIH